MHRSHAQGMEVPHLHTAAVSLPRYSLWSVRTYECSCKCTSLVTVVPSFKTGDQHCPNPPIQHSNHSIKPCLLSTLTACEPLVHALPSALSLHKVMRSLNRRNVASWLRGGSSLFPRGTRCTMGCPFRAQGGATLAQKSTAAGSEPQSGCGSSHTVQSSRAGDCGRCPRCAACVHD